MAASCHPYFKPTNYFYVKFHNINGLTKSSPVFADGFRVGIVRDLYYDYNEPGKVVAEIDVDPELRIPKGSTAELTSELMGGVKMNLLLANMQRATMPAIQRCIYHCFQKRKEDKCQCSY